MPRKQVNAKRGKKPATATIGAAGVHLLAGYLSAMGLPVAVTQKNAPSIDLLVCSPDGAKTLPVQVKTMRWAQRKDGCEWRCSPGSLKKLRPDKAPSLTLIQETRQLLAQRLEIIQQHERNLRKALELVTRDERNAAGY